MIIESLLTFFMGNLQLYSIVEIKLIIEMDGN